MFFYQLRILSTTVFIMRILCLYQFIQDYMFHLGQMTLLGAYDYDDAPDLSELTIATELVSSSEIGGVKPDIMGK